MRQVTLEQAKDEATNTATALAFVAMAPSRAPAELLGALVRFVSAVEAATASAGRRRPPSLHGDDKSSHGPSLMTPLAVKQLQDFALSASPSAHVKEDTKQSEGVGMTDMATSLATRLKSIGLSHRPESSDEECSEWSDSDGE